MGIAAVKMNLMPSSPEVDLNKIKEESKELVEKFGGKNCKFEEEPIAFGLKAIIILFAWPEKQELDSLEEELKKIENINSVQLIDIRRSFG
ncbi:MAG: elongation factor 1-beta [Candidatus Pacearchaeota archaeon]|mgnify:CR=1 FL=1|jgi:translation elongation factor aEF-1 beta|nr:elongation factor 1-beta [Candidatus Pacearchaeota archaeon]MDP7520755.1 elongation factor 1-beta [Candidatus Pacearchaeota archaeon]|tara:strand:+ start:2990 stop:3262 length:273 start_codon:yes stop_codon:yes gene_type:complete